MLKKRLCFCTPGVYFISTVTCGTKTMKWFENAYDRANTAEFILQNGHTELLTPDDSEQRVRRTQLLARPLGGLVVMMHYTHRNIYNRDTAELEPMPTPFYQAHFNYQSPVGESVTALIDFDQNFAYLKRSSEYTSHSLARPEAPDIWDQAMSALDESLYEHATNLGWLSLGRLIERAPTYQFVYERAA